MTACSIAIRNWTDCCYFTTVFDSIPENQSLGYQDDWKMRNFHWSEGCFLCFMQHHTGTLSFTERQAGSPELLPVHFGFMVSCLSLTHLPTFATNEMGFPQISILHNWLISELFRPCKAVLLSLLGTPPTACISSWISISSAVTLILDTRLHVWIDFVLLQLLYHCFKVFLVSVPPDLSGTKANWYEKLASIKSNSYPTEEHQHFQTANYEWSLNGASSQTVPEIVWWSATWPRPKTVPGIVARVTHSRQLSSSPDTIYFIGHIYICSHKRAQVPVY